MLVTPEQQVVLRTSQGQQLMQWLPEDFTQLSWGRELRQPSKCQLKADSVLDKKGNAPPITPWSHWVDVYSTDAKPKLYWSGPLVSIEMDEFGTDISAWDVAAFLAATRVPITKSWNAVDPSIPALELWQAMLSLQGLDHIVPIARQDPFGGRFDCSFTADEGMLDKTIQSLEQMGFRWTVIAGLPLLGPMPDDPIASLDKDDFIGKGLTLSRDGSRTFNDVMIRGADEIATARRELNGLNLQTIVNLDNMFGLTNVNNAAREYVDLVGKFHSSIKATSGAVLRPDVDLDINQLVPSARFALSAFGLRLSVQLESMQVTCQSGQSQTSVTLNEVPDRTEIGDMLATNGSASFPSGTRNVLPSTNTVKP